MERKKHYLVYKTTCLINGKIYIGQHQTFDPNDNYLGSGKELNEDIEKFGRANFKREILFDFDTFKEMLSLHPHFCEVLKWRHFETSQIAVQELHSCGIA